MKYHYIFSGLGLAAIMTVIKMADENLLQNKKILIIEPDAKNVNDRTWCFWEERNGNWDSIVKHTWENAFFFNDQFKVNCLDNNLYKMIEGERFYEFFKQKIKNLDVLWLNEKLVEFSERYDGVDVITNSNHYQGEYLFNSVYSLNSLLGHKKHPLLQQHFVGWFIKTEKAVFDPNESTFMDFTVEQKSNTRFMYVLPTSSKNALIEYTLFSPELLDLDDYEDEIKKYISNLGIDAYEIEAKEIGNIPMTSYPFWKNNTKRVLHIGTAGGWTKSSTGFTFKRADFFTDILIGKIKSNSFDFRDFKKVNKYDFYDALFVDVLFRENHLGKSIFSSMFNRKNPELILKFLDEKTTFIEDFKIILSCPKRPFLRAVLRRYFD